MGELKIFFVVYCSIYTTIDSPWHTLANGIVGNEDVGLREF